MLGYFHCHWYVTTKCNSRCNTCAIWKDPIYKSRESSLSSRLDLIHQIKALGFKSVDFTGGEPLLYKGLPRLIAEGRKLGLFTSLTTNGTLYNKYALQLKGKLSSLSFSLDAADRDIHNKIRGIKCYDDVIASIILARRLGETVLLKTTVCNQFIDSIPSLIRFAEKYGVLIELNPEFSYFDNERLSNANIEQLFRWWKHPNVIISHAHLNFIKDGGNQITNSLCPIGKGVISISPDNGIYSPCMHYVQEVIPIQNNDLKTTLNSAEVQAALLWAGGYYFCKNCTIPCYFETTYYTKLTKYLPINLRSRIGYLLKRFILESKIR